MIGYSEAHDRIMSYLEEQNRHSDLKQVEDFLSMMPNSMAFKLINLQTTTHY